MEPIFLEPRWAEILREMESPVPAGQSLQRRLYFLIRQAALDGRLAPGEPLPASRKLARALAVSRNTVLTALDQLIAEGFVSSRPGAGTFISDQVSDVVPCTIAVPDDGNLQGVSPADRRVSRLALRLTEHAVGTAALRRSEAAGPAVPFQPGAPALDVFPWDIWARGLGRRWRRPGLALAGEIDIAGYAPLRQAIAAHLRSTRAVSCTADQVLVVNGAQQALDLAVRLLVDPGERVWVEDPGFSGVSGILRAAGARISPLSSDEQGACLPLQSSPGKASSDTAGEGSGGIAGEVEEGEHPVGQVALLTPSRSYPLGVTMSLPRRLAWLAWARQRAAQGGGTWIIEDDFDSDFRFDGPPLASLQGLDSHHQVLYTGTFSRAMFPSIRLGYLIVPDDLIDAARAIRRMLDGGGSAVVQVALADFIADGHFRAHLRAIRRLYAARRQSLVQWLNTEMKNHLKVVPSDGGLHITCLLPQGMSDRALVSALHRHGLEAMPLSFYYHYGNPCQGLVLGYAAWDDSLLLAACRRLQTVFSTLL